MEQKVHQFAASARLRSVVEPEESAGPLSGISLEARLREAREKRERVLAEKAQQKTEGKSGPERRGNFEFGPAPFDRGNKAKTDGFPFVGSGPPLMDQEEAAGETGDAAQPDEPANSAPLNVADFRHRDMHPEGTGFKVDARPLKPHVVNPKIAEGSSAPAESVDSSRWGLDPDDDILINPKIVESMLPFTPYQVSGDEDPWFSPSAKEKLIAKQPRLKPIDPSSFIPAGESFDLGTPGELKAVFDEVKHVHERRRTKVRLVRVLAIVALVVAGVVAFPVVKGGLQPALEAILLTAPAN